MTSTFGSLDIGLSALTAQRVGLDVTGHNVANANTPGFSRQDVQLVARAPMSIPLLGVSSGAGILGRGVDVADIRRLRDAFTDIQLRNQADVLGEWQANANALGRLEQVFTEPSDANLSSLLGKFWNAWDELGNAPQNSGARASLLGQAQTLATALNQAYTSLQTVRGELDSQVATKAEEINAIASEIAALNGQIKHATVAGAAANDLKDQRDLLLDRLTGITSFQSFTDDYGSVTVYVGSSVLVDDVAPRELSVIPTADGTHEVVWKESGNPVEFQGGEMAGLLKARDGEVVQRLDQLDNLARALSDGVNAIHRQGYGLDGSTGQDFFVATGAKDIAVSQAILGNPSGIATAAAAGSPGDGSLAQKIANFRREPVAALGGASIDGYYEGIVSAVGVASQQASGKADSQALVVDNLKQRREQLSGVSLDEEATNMVRYQQAYAAAAQYIRVVDEMLDRLINQVGGTAG